MHNGANATNATVAVEHIEPLERGYLTGAREVDWKPPNSFRPVWHGNGEGVAHLADLIANPLLTKFPVWQHNFRFQTGIRFNPATGKIEAIPKTEAVP